MWTVPWLKWDFQSSFSSVGNTQSIFVLHLYIRKIPSLHCNTRNVHTYVHMYVCALCVPTNFHSIQTNTHLTVEPISHWIQYNDTECIKRIERIERKERNGRLRSYMNSLTSIHIHNYTRIPRRNSFDIIRSTMKSEGDAVSRGEQLCIHIGFVSRQLCRVRERWRRERILDLNGSLASSFFFVWWFSCSIIPIWTNAEEWEVCITNAWRYYWASYTIGTRFMLNASYNYSWMALCLKKYLNQFLGGENKCSFFF